MTDRLSKSQIDKLGERLKSDPVSDDDLRMLDEFRRTFNDAFGTILASLIELGFQPTGRSKTNDSIIAKLRRDEVKLSQMQDVVGCRIVVPNILEQDRSIASVIAAFPGARTVDRRARPRNGYRAVHIIAKSTRKPVEIQLRTKLQQLWAEFSEAYALNDPGVKYGSGRVDVRSMLLATSTEIAKAEAVNLPEFEVFREDLAGSLETAIMRVRQERSAARGV